MNRRSRATNVVRLESPDPPGDMLAKIGFSLLVACIVATPLIASDASSAIEGSGVLLLMFEFILFFGWALSLLRNQSQKGKSTPNKPPSRDHLSLRFCLVDGLVLTYALWQIIATLRVFADGNPRSTLNALWQSLGFATVYWLLRQWCTAAWQQRTIATILIGLAGGLSFVAFEQYFVSLPRDQAEFQRDPQAVMRKAGIPATAGSNYTELFANRINSKEPFATFALANSLAGFLCTWLIVGIAILGSRWFAGERDLRFLIPFAILLIVLVYCLLITKSRSAVIGAFVGLGFFAVLAVMRRWRIGWRLPLLATSLGVVLVSSAWLSGALDSQVITEAGKSLGYRWEYWRAASAMIADHGLWGVGLGNFQEAYAQYKLPQSSEMVLDPHNFVMEVAATSGVPAVLLLLAICITTGVHAARQFRQHNDGSQTVPANVQRTQLWTLVGCACLLGPLTAQLAGLENPPSGLTTLMVILLMAVTVAIMWPWLRREGRLPVEVPLSGILVLLVNLLAAGGIGFPGVAISFWVLLAVAVNCLPMGESSISLSKPLVLAVVATTFVGLAAYGFTGYLPLINGKVYEGKIMLAMQMQQFDTYLRQCDEWRKADPWTPSPYHRMAQGQVEMLAQSGETKFLDRLPYWLSESVRRDRRSHLRCREMGNLALKAWRNSNDSQYLQSSIDYYEKSTHLYPNGSLNYAQWALALHLAGRTDEAKRAAGIAFDLDQKNPHRDQKLASQMVFDAPASKSLVESMPPFVGERNAEQWVNRIRNGKTDGD